MFFGFELILRDFSVDALFAVILSAVTADLISRAFFGAAPFFTQIPHDLTVTGDYNYLLIALLGVGRRPDRGRVQDRPVQDRGPLRHGVEGPARSGPARAVGGIALGAVLLALPQMYGVGYPVMDHAIGGHIVLWLLVILTVAKMATASLTIGIGGSGGVFAPSLFTGAMAGTAFGVTAHHAFGPAVGSPAIYGVVAMGAVFAAAAQAPLTAIASVVEMTGNFALDPAHHARRGRSPPGCPNGSPTAPSTPPNSCGAAPTSNAPDRPASSRPSPSADTMQPIPRPTHPATAAPTATAGGGTATTAQAHAHDPPLDNRTALRSDLGTLVEARTSQALLRRRNPRTRPAPTGPVRPRRPARPRRRPPATSSAGSPATTSSTPWPAASPPTPTTPPRPTGPPNGPPPTRRRRHASRPPRWPAISWPRSPSPPPPHPRPAHRPDRLAPGICPRGRHPPPPNPQRPPRHRAAPRRPPHPPRPRPTPPSGQRQGCDAPTSDSLCPTGMTTQPTNPAPSAPAAETLRPRRALRVLAGPPTASEDQALVFDVRAVRRFWLAQHPWRWKVTALYSVVTLMIAVPPAPDRGREKGGPPTQPPPLAGPGEQRGS